MIHDRPSQLTTSPRELSALGQLAHELARIGRAVATQPPLHVRADALQEMAILEALTSPRALRVWEGLPDAPRVTLASLIAARCRTLQSLDPPLLDGNTLDDRVRAVFRRLSDHMKVGHPGKAYGLARRHQPRGCSWREDVLALEAELRAHLALYAPLLPGAPWEGSARALAHIARFLQLMPTPAMLREYVAAHLRAGLTPDHPELLALLQDRADDFYVRDARWHLLRLALDGRAATSRAS